MLCSLIVLCWAIPSMIRQLKRDKVQDFTDFEDEVNRFEEQQRTAGAARQPSPKKKAAHGAPLPDPFPFDPNTLSEEGWQRLGLPSKVIRTIQHYREAGGYFYEKEDLKKIYGLSPAYYDRLEAYIRIPARRSAAAGEGQSGSKKKDTAAGRRRPVSKDLLIDINAADSAEWTKLRGIGPVLSSRIIKFRGALGGFYRIDQVSEVYGLPDSVFQKIKNQLVISEQTVERLNINTATIDELKSHPYISYQLAGAIKAFRDQHGLFTAIEKLKQVQLVDDEIYRKLVPYLTVK